ncbi:MAG: PqiC family protein [Janthinobacterium lividum]
MKADRFTGSGFAAVMLAAALALGGCASAPKEHFHTLASSEGAAPPANNVAAAAAAAAANREAGRTRMPATAADYYVEVTAVNVPPQVNRNQLVVSTGGGRVEVLEQQRWASPLAGEIGRALSLGITTELGVIDVFRTPYPAKSVVYRVSTNVQRFESTPGQHALLDVVWSVRQVGASGEALSTCRSVIEESVSPGYDALVAGHAQAVRRLSAAVATTIRSMQAGLTPVCGAA